MTAGQLSEWLGGELNAPADLPISKLVTDSREIAPGVAFIAIKGERVDGHDYTAGADLAIVERPVAVPFIRVDNVVDALARMARAIRAGFEGPVVGITGSVGKTTTKEFVAAALAPLGPVLKTEGNRNTEFTGPLLWTELTDSTAAVVAEMGMRGFGQIAHLASFHRPNVGIITNIGVSHVELVGSREGIMRAKSELLEALPSGAPSLLWAEDDFLSDLVSRATGPVLTFGTSPGAMVRVRSMEADGWTHTVLEGELDGLPWRARVPGQGRPVALATAAAIGTAFLCGINPGDAITDLQRVQLPPLRMEVREIDGITYLVDAYNASPPSTMAALESLYRGPGARKFAVLGEMRELGSLTEEGHRQVGRVLRLTKLDGVCVIGPSMPWLQEEYPEAQIVLDLEGVREFLRELQPGDTVLIKGSRALELEKALP